MSNLHAPALGAPPELAPDYYLKNFCFLLKWVQQRYVDILSEQEGYFIQAFHLLERDTQCLLVRLSSRKGPLFRRDKLSYSEISNIDTAAQQLIAAGLLHSNTILDIQTLAACLTKPELLRLFGEYLVGLKQARKEVLVQSLATKFTQPRSWQGWTNNQFGAAWYVSNQPIIRNLLLLFFGNAYQSLTDFVLQDLGLFRYENYSIDHQHRVFKSRQELEQYLYLVQLREQLEDDCTTGALTQMATQLSTRLPVQLLPQSSAALSAMRARDSLLRRRSKLCNQLAYKLERAGQYVQAAELYEQSFLPPARERRIRLLEKQQEYTQAWALLSQLLEQPVNEQELQVAQRMAPRLAKKLGSIYEKFPSAIINTQERELSKLQDEQGNNLHVEEVVRQALDATNAPCVYAENALFGALFGLWLWPEMFRGVAGAFANPFQAAPLDLYQENFVVNRPGINALWASFDTGQYQQNIQQMWRSKQGIANHFVNWSFMTEDLLDMALRCLPSEHLKRIFERMLFDIKNNRCGLPDLIQFYPQKNTYRLVEVKGPGDRLQDNQQRWLNYFAKHKIPAEVCYVRWS